MENVILMFKGGFVQDSFPKLARISHCSLSSSTKDFNEILQETVKWAYNLIFFSEYMEINEKLLKVSIWFDFYNSFFTFFFLLLYKGWVKSNKWIKWKPDVKHIVTITAFPNGLRAVPCMVDSSHRRFQEPLTCHRGTLYQIWPLFCPACKT